MIDENSRKTAGKLRGKSTLMFDLFVQTNKYNFPYLKRHEHSNRKGLQKAQQSK